MTYKYCVTCHEKLTHRIVNAETVDFYCTQVRCPRFGLITVGTITISQSYESAQAHEGINHDHS